MQSDLQKISITADFCDSVLVTKDSIRFPVYLPILLARFQKMQIFRHNRDFASPPEQNGNTPEQIFVPIRAAPLIPILTFAYKDISELDNLSIDNELDILQFIGTEMPSFKSKVLDLIQKKKLSLSTIMEYTQRALIITHSDGISDLLTICKKFIAENYQQVVTMKEMERLPSYFLIELMQSFQTKISGSSESQQFSPSLSSDKLHNSAPRTLAETIRFLFETKLSADFTFLLENEKISVHKPILQVRSPFFGTMLGNQSTAKQMNLSKEKCPSKGVLQVILTYIYLDTLEIKEDNDFGFILDVVNLAKLFGVDKPHFWNAILKHTISSISGEQLASVLRIAQSSAVQVVHDIAMDIVTHNVDKLIDKEDVMHRLSSSTLADMLKGVVIENEKAKTSLKNKKV